LSATNLTRASGWTLAGSVGEDKIAKLPDTKVALGGVFPALAFSPVIFEAD
jgi:hypothetical protein